MCWEKIMEQIDRVLFGEKNYIATWGEWLNGGEVTNSRNFHDRALAENDNEYYM